MRIKVEVESEQAASGLVHGVVAIMVGEKWIPSEKWYDSLDQVLDSWVQTNESFLSGGKRAEYIFFGSEYSVVVQEVRLGIYDVFDSRHGSDGSRVEGFLTESISPKDYWTEVCRAFQSIPAPLLSKLGFMNRVKRMCKVAFECKM